MATSCYRPDKVYLPGSYKGVPFEVESASSEHGRRGDEGEFPWGETTGYVDMGRRIRTYSITGFYRNNNHVLSTDALIAAIESPGPGPLVHPTRGLINAACKSIQVDDNIQQEAGMTRFTAEFVEANDWISGFAFGADIFGLDIAPVIAALSTSFIDSYSPDDDQWYFRDSVVGFMGDEVTAIRNAYQDVTRDTRTSEQNKIISDFNAVRDDEYLLLDPVTASRVVRNGYAYIDRDAEVGSIKISAIRSVINSSPSIAVTGRAADSVNIIYALVRGVGAAYLARAYLETEPQTFDDAYQDFLRVEAIIETEMNYAEQGCRDPSLFLALKKFKGEAGRALMNRAYKSPALVTYHFSSGVPSLVASYEIFADSKRYREIEMRNLGLPWALGPNVIAPRV